MRISDCSSDVCSSDLLLPPVSPSDRQATRPPIIRPLVFCLGDTPARACREAAAESQHPPQFRYRWNTGWILRRTTRVGDAQNNLTEIGRSSCRERVCEYVYSTGVTGA